MTPCRIYPATAVKGLRTILFTITTTVLLFISNVQKQTNNNHYKTIVNDFNYVNVNATNDNNKNIVPLTLLTTLLFYNGDIEIQLFTNEYVHKILALINSVPVGISV